MTIGKPPFQLPRHCPLKAATLASLRSHVSPFFDTSSSGPVAYSSTDLPLPPTLSRRQRVSPAQFLSLLVILVAFAIQVFRAPVDIVGGSTGTSYCPRTLPSLPPPVCRDQNLLLEPLPVSRPHKMALLEEANRVAAEFEYSPENLNNGVRAFISQMRR